MTTIYLINNSLTMNNLNFPDKETLEQKREKRILSIEGEEESKRLVHNKDLQKVQYIYSSSYVMSIATAKYLAQDLELDINIRSELGERVIGNLGDKKIRMITEIQENDFDYKLAGGESLNEVKNRMSRFVNQLLEKHADKTISLYTQNVAITCLLSKWCKKGFNLDNRLILNYQDEAIIDGAWDGINMIELVFDGKDLVSIKRKNRNFPIFHFLLCQLFSILLYHRLYIQMGLIFLVLLVFHIFLLEKHIKGRFFHQCKHVLELLFLHIYYILVFSF